MSIQLTCKRGEARILLVCHAPFISNYSRASKCLLASTCDIALERYCMYIGLCYSCTYKVQTVLKYLVGLGENQSFIIMEIIHVTCPHLPYRTWKTFCGFCEWGSRRRHPSGLFWLASLSGGKSIQGQIQGGHRGHVLLLPLSFLPLNISLML